MADDGKKPLVFISHKHQDVDIAKALASWLQVATRNGVEVFQSSDGFKDGPSLGRSLTEERDANSCIRFAKELLTTSFFDGFPPLADFETTFIERVAAQLQKDLEPILPKDVANANWSPHPRLRIRVQHRDGEQVDAEHQLSSSARIVTFTGKRDRYSAILTEVRRRPFQRATVFDLSVIRQE